MIYIDNFEDEKIIPIYIGKSNDIQRRYKDHYCELLSLNRLSREEYRKYNDEGIYNGRFKSCKIFKYMIEHGCVLKDYHFIILEICPESELDSKEQYYINKFKSEYFGFNQLNITTLYQPYIHFNRENDLTLYDKYIDAFKVNCANIIKYYGWGFTKFNYEYSFPTSSIHLPSENEMIRKKFDELGAFIDNVNNSINSSIYKSQIENNKIEDIDQRFEEIKKIYKEIRQVLFPSVHYSKYQLKDNDYLEKISNNTIRFLVSNNGRNKVSDIVKIECYLNDEYKEFYIKNATTLNSWLIQYGEKDIYYRSLMQFRSNWFNIIPQNFIYYYRKPKVVDETKTSRFISVLEEYKTGINDFTLLGKTFVDLEEVIMFIINSKKEDVKINISCSEPKSILKDILVRDCSRKLINKIKKELPILLNL